MELNGLMYCNSLPILAKLWNHRPLLNFCSTELILCRSHVYMYCWPTTVATVIWLVQTQVAPQMILAHSVSLKCSVNNKDPRTSSEYWVDKKKLSTEGNTFFF